MILGIEEDDLRKSEYQKLKQIFSNILSPTSRDFYTQITHEFSLITIQRRIPINIIYDLALEPISDKSFEDMLQDAKDKVFSDLLDGDK